MGGNLFGAGAAEGGDLQVGLLQRPLQLLHMRLPPRGTPRVCMINGRATSIWSFVCDLLHHVVIVGAEVCGVLPMSRLPHVSSNCGEGTGYGG